MPWNPTRPNLFLKTSSRCLFFLSFFFLWTNSQTANYFTNFFPMFLPDLTDDPREIKFSRRTRTLLNHRADFSIVVVWVVLILPLIPTSLYLISRLLSTIPRYHCHVHVSPPFQFSEVSNYYYYYSTLCVFFTPELACDISLGFK